VLNTNTDLAAFGGAFSQHGLAQMSRSIQRQASHETERVQAQALIADTREQGRALLANTALQNVGALTALEQHLIQIAPLGEARYKHIVDAYALGAATTVSRW
jgi:phosphoribulokinase